MLSDTPRKQLATMIAEDGIKVAYDARLCEALLRDYCGEFRVEIAALTAAVKWGVPKSLGDVGMVPGSALRASLARRLMENHGLAEESAFWAVDSWASVLNVTLVSDPLPAPPEKRSSFHSGETWSMPQPVSPVTFNTPPPPAPPPKPQLPPLPQVQSPPPSPVVKPQLPPLPQAPSPSPVQPPPLVQSPARPPSQPQSPLMKPQLPPLPQGPLPPQGPSPPLVQSPPLPPVTPTPSPVLKPQLPPLPQVQSPVRPPSQPQSPVMPQLPPLPQVQSPAATQGAPLLAGAQSFERGEASSQLFQLQLYLKTQLHTRKHDALLEELQAAGVEHVTASRLVKQARRGAAIKHVWIAFALCGACFLMLGRAASESASKSTSETVGILGLLFFASLGYLVFRGILLLATF